MTAEATEAQVAKEVSAVSKVEIDEKCGLDMSSYQDLSKSNGINPVCANVDENSDTTEGSSDNSYVFVNGSGDDPVHEVISAVESEEVSPQSRVSSEKEVNFGETEICVQKSDAGVDSLVKDKEGLVQVANETVGNDVMAPKTDTRLELVDACVQPAENTESQVVVLEAENKESVGGQETETPDASDANGAEIKEFKASEVLSLGQDSQIVVSELSGESLAAKNASPDTIQTDDENKETEEPNLDTSNDLSQGQNYEVVVVAENVESGEETKVMSPLVKESGFEDKEINDEVLESKDLVDAAKSGDNGELEILLPDLIVEPGEELKVMSPLEKEYGDENKEINNEVQECEDVVDGAESGDRGGLKMLPDLETGDENKEEPEGKIVKTHELTEAVGNQSADIESMKTNSEEQNDFESGRESCNVEALEASVFQPAEVTVDRIKEESEGKNVETCHELTGAAGNQSTEIESGKTNVEEHKDLALEASLYQSAEVTVENDTSEDGSSLHLTDDLTDNHKSEDVIVEAIECRPGTDDESIEGRDSQDAALNAPESALKEVNFGILNCEQPSEVEPLKQVEESGISQVPVGLGSGLTDDGREKEIDEERTDQSSDGKEIHVPDTAHNQDIQVNLEAKSSVNDTNAPLETSSSALDENEDDSRTSESAQKIEELNGCLDGGENSRQVNGSEINGKPVEGDENLPLDSIAVTAVQLATLSDANKCIEDVPLCPVDKTNLDTVESETVVENNISSCPGVNDEVLGSEAALEAIDSGDKVQSIQGDDLHSKAQDVNGDAELSHSCAISSDVKELDSQVEDSCTLGNDLVATKTAVLDSSAVDKESASNVVVLDTEVVAASTPEQHSTAEEELELMIGVTMRPFNFLIRIPRFDDEKIRERMRHAQLQVEEKTKSRDAFRLEIQKQKATLQSVGGEFEAAIGEDRDARRLVKKKRMEIDSVQALINRVKNAVSVEDIDARIYSIEYMMQHETLDLKDEKKFIREMKQLKQHREQLSSNIGTDDEVQQALDQRDQIDGRMKVLKKELEGLKTMVSKAQAVATTARRKYDDESRRFKELQDRFKAADGIRQGAYAQLLSLRRELYDKNKEFRMYKEDTAAASDYALNRQNEALHRLCVKQVNEVMELWNKNDEFRKEYVRCNLRSTVRRLGTVDGRSLGPDEESPVVPSYASERVDRLTFNRQKPSSVSQSAVEQKREVTPVEVVVVDDKPTTKVEESEKKTVDMIEPATSTLANGVLSSAAAAAADTADTINVSSQTEEEQLQTNEELELARKAEELRKQEEAAKLKEQRRVEELAKAREAHERKLRNDKKAQMKAELRAQKEAEQKEKEREKRLRKKERKKAVAAEDNSDGENAQSSNSVVETMKEPEIKEIQPTTVTKRSHKPSQFAKQSKSKSIPPPLRNRNRRKMQQWMWVISTSVVVIALFFLGNIGIFSSLKPRKTAGF